VWIGSVCVNCGGLATLRAPGLDRADQHVTAELGRREPQFRWRAVVRCAIAAVAMSPPQPCPIVAAMPGTDAAYKATNQELLPLSQWAASAVRGHGWSQR
jgi:hypothetical protein